MKKGKQIEGSGDHDAYGENPEDRLETLVHYVNADGSAHNPVVTSCHGSKDQINRDPTIL